MNHTPQEEQAIREASYYAWERAGKPSGDEFAFWLEAERAFDAQKQTPHDVVDEASEESFPASDAPAWMP